jgi:hypothetical protein
MLLLCPAHTYWLIGSCWHMLRFIERRDNLSAVTWTSTSHYPSNCLSASPSAHTYDVCLSICLSVCLSVCLRARIWNATPSTNFNRSTEQHTHSKGLSKQQNEKGMCYMTWDQHGRYSTVRTNLIHSLYSQILSSWILLQCLSGIRRPRGTKGWGERGGGGRGRKRMRLDEIEEEKKRTDTADQERISIE